MKKLFVLLCSSSLMFQIACSDSKPNNTGKVLGYTLVYLSSIWQRVTVADVPGFSYVNKDGMALTPGCSSCPPTVDATTGKTTNYNPDFAFFVKRGSTNNLLIFFMGGGACWDITNCVYNHTYSEQLIESQLLLGFASTGGLEGRGLGGIMDTSEPDNPFNDWTIVWVPYCTADLGMGEKDYTYTNHTHTGTYPDPGPEVVIHHRGLVNVKLVLEWMKNNITFTPGKLFVTGVSAGSYTALMSYPRIREAFPPPTEGYMLGDAGVGVTGTFIDGATTALFFETGQVHWGAVLPDQIPAFTGKTISEYSNYKDIFYEVAKYYTSDNFAQYTSKWDKTQTWFYNIQSGDSINHPDLWGSESSADPDPIEWSGLMMPPGAIDIGTANYSYFIGPGTNHTILLFPAYYTEESGGVLLSDWVKSFINNEAVIDQPCATCPLP